MARRRAVALVAAVLLPLAQPSSDAAGFGWLKGTTFHWNQWRHVVFGDDGVFNAPDEACANASCTWSADADSVHVDWGAHGRHTLRPTAMLAAPGTELRGSRLKDGDACTATWVKPLRGVAPGQLERFYALHSGDDTSFLLPPAHCSGVTAAMINDDYCDCGYDEPHTAACSVSDIRGPVETTAAAVESSRSFWCVNTGWRGSPLLVSRLGDGICDCCDGSDEPQGSCAPTCARKAAEENLEIRKKLNEATAALALKAEGAEAGRQSHASWVADLPRLQSELDALLPTFDELEASHAALLQREADQNEAEAAHAAAALEAAPEPATEGSSTDGAAPQAQECDWDGLLRVEPGAAVFAEYQDLGVWMAALVVAVDDADGGRMLRVVYTEDGEEESDIEAARIRPRAPDCEGLDIDGAEQVVGTNASCGETAAPTCRAGYAGGSQPYVCRGDGIWHPIGDAAPLQCTLRVPRAPTVLSVVVEDQALLVSFRWKEENNATFDVTASAESGGEAIVASTKEGTQHAPFVVSRSKGMARVNVSALTNDVAYSISVAAVNAAGHSIAESSQIFAPSSLKAQFSSATDLRASTTKTITSLKKKLALATAGDLGADFEYAALLDKCVTGKGKSGGHSYKVCGFSTVDQKDDSGKWIRIGRWEGWNRPPGQSHRGTMSYAGGARCGADKQPRSAQVVLSCASEPKIIEATEPTSCAYLIELGSPVACVPTDVPILWPEESTAHEEL